MALSGISCEEVLQEIEHYLHGELDPSRSTSLALHLERCAPCLDRAEFKRRLREIVRAKCRSECPEDLIRRVQDAIRGEPAGGP